MKCPSPGTVLSYLFFHTLSLNLRLALAEEIPVSIGDSICVNGYIMDYYCTERGTLFEDANIVTLSSVGPSSHSVHCLIDVPQCVDSPFEVLVPLNDGSGNFGRAWRIEDNTDIVSHAKEIGSCRDCDEGYVAGKVSKGYQATLMATVRDLGSTSTPALIQVTSVQDNEVGCGGLKYEIPSMISTADGGGGVSFATLVLIHGGLMVVGWGLLLPAGVIIARLAKHRPNGLWFKIHSILQPFALVLVIAGFWVALQNFSALGAATGSTSHSHAICGVITMAFGILQPFNAFLRPHVADGSSKSFKRVVWEIVHKGIGYAIVVLAAATIIMGTKITPVPEDGNKFLITYVVFVGILVFLILALLLDKYVLYEPVANEETEKDADE